MRKPKPLTAQQAADILGLSAKTLYNGGAGTRQIPRVKVGRSVRWDEDEVIDFWERMHDIAASRLRFRARKTG